MKVGQVECRAVDLDERGCRHALPRRDSTFHRDVPSSATAASDHISRAHKRTLCRRDPTRPVRGEPPAPPTQPTAPRFF